MKDINRISPPADALGLLPSKSLSVSLFGIAIGIGVVIAIGIAIVPVAFYFFRYRFRFPPIPTQNPKNKTSDLPSQESDEYWEFLVGYWIFDCSFQVETCLFQKPLFTQAGDNLEIRVTAQEDRVQGSGFRRIAGLFGA